MDVATKMQPDIFCHLNILEGKKYFFDTFMKH